MKNECVAILDIRSYEVTFFLGSKGVNDTFVFYGSHTQKYEGFSTQGFYDEESFRRAVVAAITSVRQNYEGIIGEIYVGVPSAFIQVQTKGHTVSFPSKRKISSQDISLLFDSGLNELLVQKRCIRHSNMYYTLGDNHKYYTDSDLFGVPTTLLQGALCYYLVDDTFYNVTNSVLNDLGFNEVHLLPTSLAQCLYLLPPKRREGYAFLLDVGFLTSSFAVVYGNGIVREETIDSGLGSILVSLMQQLDVSYETAQEILATANVSGGNIPRDLIWTSENGELSFPVYKINDTIKCALDVLCEHIERFFDTYYKEKAMAAFAVNPIDVTGEGIFGVAGATEHIAKRLNRLTEVAFPDLPYYDKPTYSSRMSLLSMALSDSEKKSWWHKLFKKNGGRK